VNKRIEETKLVLQQAFDKYDSFFFTRMGDADLLMIDGLKQAHHHTNSPELTEELKEILQIIDERYILSATVGIYDDGTGAYGHITDEDKKIKLDNNLRKIVEKYRPIGIEYHPLVFQYCFEHEPEWFINFFKKNFEGKKTLFIGGDYTCDKPMLYDLLNVSEVEFFPGQKNAYYKLNKRIDSILKKASNCDIIVPCLGQATRVLSKRLWKENINKVFLDVGVVVDILAEDYHRRWATDMLKQGVVEKYKGLLG